MAHAQLQSSFVTYADYQTWPDFPRYELFSGEVYAMAPAPSINHQRLAGDIYRQASNTLKNKSCQVFIAPVDVLFPQPNETDEQISTVLQPDVFIVCDAHKVERQAVRGAPDWVVEVLSPGTAARDHIAKRRIYETAGVREYWLVDPETRMLMIYQLQQGVYGKPEVQELIGTTPIGILPEIVIEWDEMLPPMAEDVV